MEFFVVFLLGIMLGVGLLYLLKPSLFVNNQSDYALLDEMFVDYMNQLEEKQAEMIEKHELMLKNIEKREQEILHLYSQLQELLDEELIKSPKVQAVVDLLELGNDEVTVAKRLGMGLGEVQLIASLTKSFAS